MAPLLFAPPQFGGGVSGKRLRVLKMERFIHFQGYGVT